MARKESCEELSSFVGWRCLKNKKETQNKSPTHGVSTKPVASGKIYLLTRRSNARYHMKKSLLKAGRSWRWSWMVVAAIIISIILITTTTTASAFPKPPDTNSVAGRKRVILHDSRFLEVVMNILPAEEEKSTGKNKTAAVSSSVDDTLPRSTTTTSLANNNHALTSSSKDSKQRSIAYRRGKEDGLQLHWLLSLDILLGATVSIALLLQPQIAFLFLFGADDGPHGDGSIMRTWIIRMVGLQHVLYLVAIFQASALNQAFALSTTFWGLAAGLCFTTFGATLEPTIRAVLNSIFVLHAFMWLLTSLQHYKQQLQPERK